MPVIHFKKSTEDIRISTEGLIDYKPRLTDEQHYRNKKNDLHDDVIVRGHIIVLHHRENIITHIQFKSRKDTMQALQSLDSNLECISG